MSKDITKKEQLVIDTFERLRPGHGRIAKSNILNPNSGWREIIEQMTEEEIDVTNLNEGDEVSG